MKLLMTLEMAGEPCDPGRLVTISTGVKSQDTGTRRYLFLEGHCVVDRRGRRNGLDTRSLESPGSRCIDLQLTEPGDGSLEYIGGDSSAILAL